MANDDSDFIEIFNKLKNFAIIFAINLYCYNFGKFFAKMKISKNVTNKVFVASVIKIDE